MGLGSKIIVMGAVIMVTIITRIQSPLKPLHETVFREL
jgi:hypothetical protein